MYLTILMGILARSNIFTHINICIHAILTLKFIFKTCIQLTYTPAIVHTFGQYVMLNMKTHDTIMTPMCYT